MAKIVEPPKPKRISCNACEAVIEYLPEEVQSYSGTDYGGGPDGCRWVDCPRDGCPGRGVIESW